jgi:hypothetical protein
MSERVSNETAWRIIRLRLEKKSGLWRATGLCDGRLATILLPANLNGESTDQWLERIYQAFQRATAGASRLELLS